MRKKSLIKLLILLVLCITGCTSGKVKVYNATEAETTEQQQINATAVVTGLDAENKNISLVSCINGNTYLLSYSGGSEITNTYGSNVDIGDIAYGSVVDVVYNSDTSKLVSMHLNESAIVLKNVNKFSASVESGTAKYKGTSVKLSDYVVAYDGDKQLDISEINTEDQVTLNIYNGYLVSASVELGHGYVKLTNQDTYVGGMVEIGYDVIVPVTSDMLIAVREGDYTLRINKGGYSNSKEVTVIKGEEVTVNLSDIAIPSGTAVFVITPPEALMYVNGSLQESHAFTGVYGTYGLKITAEGYNTFNGSFKIDDAVKELSIELVETESTTEEETTETTTEATTATETTTATTTAEGTVTGNTVTIKAPVGAGVYVDGDYVGYAPVTFAKTAGTHTIVLFQKGYLIKSYTIESVDDGTDDEYSYPALTSLNDLID